jgi:hypothetical protein
MSGIRAWFDNNILILVTVGLVATLPCVIYGFPFYGDDSVSNAILYSQFSRQFWSGELYPRWLQGLNGGLGNPTAFYYPPLSYWLTSLLRPIFAQDEYGWRQLGWSAVAAVISSGVTIYFWLRRTVDPRPALIASLSYLVLPYHLHIDLYSRGALAELWSFVWMPLVLWAVDALIDRRRIAVAALACAYALLILTHLPTTLIFSVVPLTYGLFLSAPGARVRTFLLSVAGMSLGAGIAAIYLLPALWMQDFIFHTTQGIGGHYYFGNWFLFSGLKWSGKNSEYFAASLGVMLLALLAFGISYFGPLKNEKRAARFWFVVALVCFFMMMPLSKPVWVLLPTLQKIQFPFRFNTILSLAVAPLIVFALTKLSLKQQRIFLVVLVLFAMTWIFNASRRAYYSYPAIYLDQTVVDGALKRQELKRDTNEFRPRWVVSIEENELDALLGRIRASHGGLSKVNVTSGDATASVEGWTPREIVLNAEAKTAATLNLSRFYFPGWTLLVDDAQVPGAIEPSKPGGLISVKTPAGKHRLVLQLRKRWPEVLGQIVSLGCLVVMLLLGMGTILRSRKSQVREAENPTHGSGWWKF